MIPASNRSLIFRECPEQAPRSSLQPWRDRGCCSGFVQLIGVDPEHDFTIARWLETHPGVVMGKDDIIVGSRIDGDTGSDLKFYGHTFHIAGKLDPTGMMGIDMVVFTRIEDVYAMAEESGIKAERTLAIPQGMVSSVLVTVEPGISPVVVGDEIRKQIPGTRTITPTSLLTTVTLHIAGITSLLYGSAVVVMLISIPLLAFISFTVSHELRQEIALLGALGVTRDFHPAAHDRRIIHIFRYWVYYWDRVCCDLPYKFSKLHQLLSGNTFFNRAAPDTSRRCG